MVDRHGPVNRMRPISPNVEHITSKKNKIREISPKRRHLKRSASPFEKSRREIISPVAKKRDKGEKVREKILKLFLTTIE